MADSTDADAADTDSLDTDATDEGGTATESAGTESLAVESELSESLVVEKPVEKRIAEPGRVEPGPVESAADEMVIADVAADTGSRLQRTIELTQIADSGDSSAGVRASAPGTTRGATRGDARVPTVEGNSRNESIVLIDAAASNWLMKQSRSSYTLQLATADDDLYLAEFAASADLPRGWQIVVLPVSDERTVPRSFTLLVGVFDSYQSALDALSQLTDEARKFDARVRNIGVLQPGRK